MKARIILPALVLVLAAWTYALATSPALSTEGYAINSKGTGDSPVAVGTATPVIILPSVGGANSGASRCNWAINWTGTGDLVCEPFGGALAAPVVTPTATHGFIMTHGMVWTDNATLGDSSLGWSCVSTSGTLTIFTAEFAHCLKKGENP